MGADSSIQWCDDTLNMWMGCTKVSDGCNNCYAEVETPVRVHRGRGLELWGPKAARHETKGWRSNLASFVREARRTGRRRRVFAQSLSDTFEDRTDLIGVRERLFAALDELDGAEGEPWHESPLDILLLTKRPENILRMVPWHWLEPGCWPAHIWIGCTVENQAMADERIPHLLRVPAAVRFLSVEPQLEAIDLTDFIGPANAMWDGDFETSSRKMTRLEKIHWVIQGGESGRGARPFDLTWARSLRDQCTLSGVKYFLKQLGANAHQGSAETDRFGSIAEMRDSHGGDESEWPADLQGCRAFPEVRP